MPSHAFLTRRSVKVTYSQHARTSTQSVDGGDEVYGDRTIVYYRLLDADWHCVENRVDGASRYVFRVLKVRSDPLVFRPFAAYWSIGPLDYSFSN
jgi:hypothetical protein